MSKPARIVLGSSILCLLTAIIFPVFQRVPEDQYYPAHGCTSNMKQLGLALLQYTQDSDNKMPIVSGSAGKGWREAIYPFVKTTGIYRCPDDKHDSGKDTPQNLPTSYASNPVLLGKSVPTVSDPTKVVVLTDTRNYMGEDWDIVRPAFLPSTGRRLYAHFPTHAFYERPVGKLNLLFADGHVKQFAPMATLSPVNLWTRDNRPFVGPDLVNAQAILKHAEDE